MSDDVTRRAFLGTTAGIVLASHARAAGAAAVFAPDERRGLEAAMDAIVPGDGRMPAASAAGSLAYIENVADADGDIRKGLQDVLRTLGPDFAGGTADARVAALRALERDRAAAFALLRDLVYEAYYTSPEVLQRLGYPVRTASTPGVAPTPFDEGPLERVRQMPRLYREAP
jgi:hypothetical protein